MIFFFLQCLLKRQRTFSSLFNQASHKMSSYWRPEAEIKNFFIIIKQLDSMSPSVSSVIDHRTRQDTVGTLVTHSRKDSCASFLFLTYFNGIGALLLNRRSATWILSLSPLAGKLWEYLRTARVPTTFLQPANLPKSFQRVSSSVSGKHFGLCSS